MKKTLTPEAKDRLGKVIKWLAQGAPHVLLENGQEVGAFYMDEGFRATQCGAVCCIAGALVAFHDPFSPRYIRDYMGDRGEMSWGDVRDRAMHLLQLDTSWSNDRHLAEMLFRPGGEFDNTWITPTIAARVLSEFMSTGVLDWLAYRPEGWDCYAVEPPECEDWEPLVIEEDKDDEEL